MKAILIDPIQRRVIGIEVDLANIDKTFIGPSKIPLDVAHIHIDEASLLFFDRNGVLKHPADFFYLDGVFNPIFGKALYMGYKNGSPRPSPLSARALEPLVGFHQIESKG